MAWKILSTYIFTVFLCAGYHGQTICQRSSPYPDGCVHRVVFNRTERYVPVVSCSENDVTPPNTHMVLLDVKTANLTSLLNKDMQDKLKHEKGPGEISVPCLFQRLRGHVTGLSQVSVLEVNHNGCNIHGSYGYFVMEFVCIKDSGGSIDTRSCSATFNGTKLSLINYEHSNGTGNITCRYLIQTNAHYINITTYTLDLTASQSVAFYSRNNTINMTNTTMVDINRTDSIVVDDPMYFTWFSHEPIIQGAFRFWMELEANGSDIKVSSVQEVTTNATTTKSTPSSTSTTEQITKMETTKHLATTTKPTPSSTSITEQITKMETTKHLSTRQSTHTFTAGYQTASFSGPVNLTTDIYIPSIETATYTSNPDSSVAISASTDNPDESKFPWMIIVGIVLGLLFVAAIVIAIVVWYQKRQKKKKERQLRADATDEDERTEHGEEGGDYRFHDQTKLSTPLVPPSSRSFMESNNTNTAFNTNRLPPLTQHSIPLTHNGKHNGTSQLNEHTDTINTNKTETNIINEETNGTEDGAKKKKKKKKKKRSKDNNEEAGGEERGGENEGEEGAEAATKTKKKKKKRNKVHPVNDDDDTNGDGNENPARSPNFHDCTGAILTDHFGATSTY